MSTNASSLYEATSFPKPLRVLLVEDSPNDAELLLLELRRAGFVPQSERIDTAQGLAEMLSQRWDLVLCDYTMPRFDAIAAIEMIRSHNADLPVLVVSGTMGEEVAVAVMKAGAQDYLMKERLFRLGEAVRRELVEVQVRKQRRAAEAALRTSQDRLIFALDAAQMGIWDWDISSGFVRWSPQIEQIFGMQVGSFDGTYPDYRDRVHPEDIDHLESEVRLCLEDAQRTYRVEHRILMPSDEIRWVECRGEIIFDEQQRPLRMVGTITDITGRHELEAQLLQSQKLEAMGRLAGGVAHDFNNLLTVILSYSTMAEQELAGLDVATELISPVREAAQRASSMTRQLLMFARQGIAAPQSLVLDRVIQNVSQVLYGLVGERIALHFEMAQDLWSVWIDRGRCEQVLVNLVINARDAIAGRGNIVVRVSNKTYTPASLGPHDVPEGEWVLLEVCDDGSGMSAQTRNQVFEPFFTTKEYGRGTGLGLATCHTAIAQAKGLIFIDSVLGEGTTFSVYIPRSFEVPTQQLSESLRSAIPTGDETIFVVEDDAMVRNMVERSLSRLGYRVFTAPSAEEALPKLRKTASWIDLLLVDLDLPDRTGAAMVESLRKEGVECAVLYVSGNEGEAIAHGIGASSLFCKPYSVMQLARKIRRMFDRNEGLGLDGGAV